MQSRIFNMFAGKVVLITGASSGIGAETAIRFAAEGASVVLTGRNAQNLENVAQKCKEKSNTKPLVVTGDITQERDIANVIDTTIKTYGKLDILINNAGILSAGTIETTTVEEFDAIFSTNVRSVYLVTKMAVPHLIKTKGNIVNVSSLAARRSFPNILAYCMSKAAIDQFTKCTALELAPKHVRVNSVNPGLVETDIHRRAGMPEEEYKQFLQRSIALHPLGRYGKPEDVVSAIVYFASDQASYITGEGLVMDGGRHIVCPR